MRIIDEKTGNYIDVIQKPCGEIIFYHVQTNQECADIDAALSNFSEQNEKDNEGWDRIREIFQDGNHEVWEFLNQDCEEYTI